MKIQLKEHCGLKQWAVLEEMGVSGSCPEAGGLRGQCIRRLKDTGDPEVNGFQGVGLRVGRAWGWAQT